MRKIKIFKISLQSSIDEWIEKEKPMIISTSLSSTVLKNGNIQHTIAILYEEYTSDDVVDFGPE